MAIKKTKSKGKTYKGEWYTVNSVFGNDWAIFYALMGGREAGKSYSVMEWATRNKLKKGDQFKFYWFRLTEAAADNLLADGGSKLVDPDLKKKYNIKTTKKNHTIYTYKEVEKEKKDGTIIKEKTDIKEFCEVLACSTFYNTKGVGYFDNTFKGEYFIVLDEMNREQSERNGFDIVYNFVNLLENIARSTKNRIKVVMIGNTLEEASDILAAFNFIPDDFGRYKLKSKRAVIDYIRPNEKYLERRKGTMADILLPDASTFTNEIKIDRTLLVNKRKRIAAQYIVKFNKTKDTWFTVWNNNIVHEYNGESKYTIAMRRYLDEQFYPQQQAVILEQFDARAYKFTSLSCFKKFQKQMRLLKPQK
jgi:hypothetical protein